MTIGPALNGFVKGLFLTVIGAIVLYIGDPSHLAALPDWVAMVAPLAVAILSAIESKIKANTGNGLFGAVRVSR